MNQNHPYNSAPPPRKAPTEASLRRRLFFIRFLFFAAAIALALWFLIACRVETVIVEGAVELTQTDILDAANIKNGKHLLAVSENKTEKAILSISPYAKSATIKLRFPKTVIITVEEYTPRYHTENDGICYVLSEDLTVLDVTSDPIFAKAKAKCRLMIPKIKEGVIGQRLTLLDKSEQARITPLLQTFEKNPLIKDLTSLDLIESWGITAVINDQYTVHFGNAEKLAEKLKLCQKSVSYLEKHMSRVAGTLYARNPKEVSFVMTGVVNQK